MSESAPSVQRAIDEAGSSETVARIHRKTAAAWLAQHDAATAEEHLAAAEALATDPAERPPSTMRAGRPLSVDLEDLADEAALAA